MQSLPLSTLTRCENAVLGQRLGALAAHSVVCVDAPGLDAVEHQIPVAVRLELRGAGRLSGALRAAADAWPFCDQSIDVVMLRHAFEFETPPKILLNEALRVVARGGHVLIAGVHPLSPWHVWTLRRMRALQPAYRARLPWSLESWMRAAGMRIESRARYGGIAPGDSPAQGAGALAACYLLHARRSSSAVTPIRLARSRRPAPVAINASLAGAPQRRQVG